MSTPRHEHDCDVCTFIGRDEGEDVYVCPQGGMPTVIFRWGSDGPEYRSGAHLLDMVPAELRDAARSALVAASEERANG